MTMFLLQALLWLLVAFLLGYGIGRFLKSLFCRPAADAEIHPYRSVDVASPRVNKEADVRVNVPAVALGGAAAAVGAVAAARTKLDAKVDVPDVSLKMPKVDVPDVSLKMPKVDVPDVSLKMPKVDVPDVSLKIPKVDVPDVSLLKTPRFDVPDVSLKIPKVDVPDISLNVPKVDAPDVLYKMPKVDVPDALFNMPKVDVPDVSLKAPSLDIDLPEVEVKAPRIDFGSIDPHKPIINPPDLDIRLPAVDVALPEVDLPDVSVRTPVVNVDTGSGFFDAAKVAVVAAGAGLAAKAASAFSVDDKALPEVDLPDVSLQAPSLDVDLPKVSLDAPSLDVGLPDIDLPEVDVKAPSFDFSGIDPHKPIIDPPDMDISLPELDIAWPEVDLPEVSLDAPSLDVDLPDIDVKVPALDVELPKVSLDTPSLDIDLPDVSVQAPEVDVDTGSGWFDAAKVAVVAAGAGLAAKVASAGNFDFSGIDPHKPIIDPPDMDTSLPLVDGEFPDWLLLLVKQAKETFRGHNPRAVSRLWSKGSYHDCSVLEGYDSLTLQPATYDKLGSSHCGVPRAGFVAVGGDVGNIEVGSGVLFHYCNIVVCRDADDNHYFIHVVTA